MADRLKTANEINQNLENKLRNAKGDDVQNMMNKIREAQAADIAKFQKVNLLLSVDGFDECVAGH